MNRNPKDRFVFQATSEIISEINELIHNSLDKKWLADGWKKLESGSSPKQVHPLIATVHLAHRQIEEFARTDSPGMTREIFELTELAIKINALKRKNVRDLDGRLLKLCSHDFKLYRTARYEIQIGKRRGSHLKY